MKRSTKKVEIDIIPDRFHRNVHRYRQDVAATAHP